MATANRSDVGSNVRAVVLDVVQNAERYLMYVFYVYILFIIVAEVIRRYVLGFSSLWGAETARFAFIYLTYLGISWGVYKRVHIRIDAIYKLVSERVENYLYLFSDVMIFVFAVYAIQYTIPVVQTSLQYGSTTQALRVNRAFFQVSIIIGFSLLIIRLIQRTYHDIQDIRRGEPVYKGENIFIDEEVTE